ncbi:MAG: outer membrane beta-barrel protein [Sphingobacteriales bacterium]|jgi:hypothetical protein|nr:outer membrane beta-barrel protein [Sphingobacteriales bacterium]MBP9140826.1 outer membrane beta-barrel protein [Chitinophagales bacterium]MDA0198366.1 outer membrane beta-barrel protein [Bacteroidota bacterium]MBK6891192.1 outer membrane beta-barrel protein [Sphingobacteriales bacterium]MBK7526983.1 outer membrane beta-barrel protein [Sphingobacteriales bacterium]
MHQDFDNNNKAFDNQLRQKLQRHEMPFNANDWDIMNAQLNDSASPRVGAGGNWVKPIVVFIVGATLISGLFTGYYYLSNLSNDKQTPSAIQSQSTISNPTDNTNAAVSNDKNSNNTPVNINNNVGSQTQANNNNAEPLSDASASVGSNKGNTANNINNLNNNKNSLATAKKPIAVAFNNNNLINNISKRNNDNANANDKNVIIVGNENNSQLPVAAKTIVKDEIALKTNPDENINNTEIKISNSQDINKIAGQTNIDANNSLPNSQTTTTPTATTINTLQNATEPKPVTSTFKSSANNKNKSKKIKKTPHSFNQQLWVGGYVAADGNTVGAIENPQAGFALGGSIDWRFAQQISLGMGLSVGQKRFSPSDYILLPGNQTAKSIANFTLLETPVWLKYHFPDFKRPWYPFAAAGISVYWPLKERFVYSGLDDVAAFQIANNYNSQSELSSTDNKLLLDITSTKPFNKPIFDILRFEAGIIYAWNKSTQITSSLQVHTTAQKHRFDRSLANAIPNSNKHFTSIGLRVGVTHRL